MQAFVPTEHVYVYPVIEVTDEAAVPPVHVFANLAAKVWQSANEFVYDSSAVVDALISFKKSATINDFLNILFFYN